MKQQWKKMLALGLVLTCVSPVTASAEVTINTELGGKEYDITYSEVPQRVVTLANFTTEMLLELGLSDKIVGYGYMDNEDPRSMRRNFRSLPVFQRQAIRRRRICWRQSRIS